MKRITGLFLVVMLLVGVVCSTTVAFAEESATTPTRTVEYVDSAFKNLNQYKNLQANGTVGEDFNLDNTWLLNKATVESVFPGINYELKNSDDGSYAVAEGSDSIVVNYCSPSGKVKEDWTVLNPDKKTEINAVGYWRFRYVVKDSDNNVMCKSSIIELYFYDLSAPTAKISTTGTDVVTNGLTAGTSKSVSTGWITTTDKSSVTTTYTINKLVNGTWTKIFDYDTKEVTEGYEDVVSATGAITATEKDITADKSAVYRVIYSVKDANGFVIDAPVNVDLYVKAPVVENETNSAQVWKIILYVIAGLCLVGIVVLLFIKPQPKAEESHPAAPANNEQND